jgi:hypothetical protein
MAAGILVIGFLLIAGTFPVGVKLTAVATERSIGAIASEEALAKIDLYGIDPNMLPWDRNVPFDGDSIAQYWSQTGAQKSPFISYTAFTNLRRIYGANFASTLATEYFQAESLYPSTVRFDPLASFGSRVITDLEDPQRYFWSALCRRLDQTSQEVQVTLFVSRMAGDQAKYPQFTYNRPKGTIPAAPWTAGKYPTPVPVQLQTITGSHIGYQIGATKTYYFQKLSVVTTEKTKAAYFSKEAILLDDRYGRLMRVMDVRLPDPTSSSDLGEITLFRPPDTDGNPATVVAADGDGMLLVENAATNTVYYRQVWVIPPAISGMAPPAATVNPPKVAGRNPCVGVYQGQL